MAIAGAEAQRQAEPDAEKRKYPGGAFDPLGLSKDSKVRPRLESMLFAIGTDDLNHSRIFQGGVC